MTGYWPWWAGAVGLAAVTIVYTLLTERSFGVSSAWDRVLHWRRERRLERMEEEFTDDAALAEALAAATAEHFGTIPVGSVPAGGVATDEMASGGVPGGMPGAAPARETELPSCDVPLDPDLGTPVHQGSSVTNSRPTPLVAQAALLVSIFVGGFVAATVSGRFKLRYDMGPGFSHLVTANPVLMVVLLFVGGIMVGFGTRLAGGCSSGHGLSGCGRLRPVSMVATAVFFGTAVAVSFLLWKVI
jgi:uncharacterized protein